jgi:2-polyprenyl-3-methyl-5-hydroxy-6-metoxy-1,4-benzoquinol methylase
VCVDIDNVYVDRLMKSYGHLANVSVYQCDLEDRQSLFSVANDRPPDSILCSNVLEHVKDDVQVLRISNKTL